MKNIGIVKDFDGYVGTIINNQNKEYLLLKKELLNNIKKDDVVTFRSEEINTELGKENIARFVKKFNDK